MIPSLGRRFTLRRSGWNRGGRAICFLSGRAGLRCLNLFSGLYGTTEVVPFPTNMRSRGLSDDAKRGRVRFVLCVQNEGYPAGLELRKIYQVLVDEYASKRHQLRVIDQSGEDYLYPEGYFIFVGS
jgi:hypothetical protein